jgi:putative methyltransferase (TIGR04325 family)
MNKIRKFIPPVIYIFLKNLIYHSNKKFKTHEEVERYLKTDYNDFEIAKVVSIKTRNLINSVYDENYLYSSEDLKLLSLFYLKEYETEYKVLDVGGGSGLHYHIVKSFKGNNLFKWDVLETPEMVKYNSDNLFKELFFHENLKVLKENNYDLIFLSGVIQYVKNPYKFLDDLLDIESKKIVITRTPFNFKNEEFYSIQKSFLSENGPGILPSGFKNRLVKYPHFSFNFNYFIKYLNDKGFKTISTVYEGEWTLNRENYKMLTLFISK